MTPPLAWHCTGSVVARGDFAAHKIQISQLSRSKIAGKERETAARKERKRSEKGGGKGGGFFR
jgi:hypothetical protein